MEPRISFLTLGVSDLERSTAFYRDGLGLPVLRDRDSLVYFALHGGLVFGLYPRDALARFVGVETGGEGFRGVTLSCNVASRDAVDATMAEAEAAGARVVSAPRPFSWGGYAGWFADPDEHLWEVVWNPRPFI